MWQVFQWPSGDQMRHLKIFILSEGRRYQDLVPFTDHISTNQSAGPKAATGWAFGAATPERDLLLFYFEKDCPQTVVSGAKASARYSARYFNPRHGQWNGAAVAIVADASGHITLPPFPNQLTKSDDDWALKLTQAGGSLSTVSP